jgi:hypothetical protein
VSNNDIIERDDAPAASAPARHPHRPKRFLSRTAQAKRWGKSKRTVERWGRDPKMGLPLETWLNNVPHRLEEELEVWEAARLGKNLSASPVAQPHR